VQWCAAKAVGQHAAGKALVFGAGGAGSGSCPRSTAEAGAGEASQGRAQHG